MELIPAGRRTVFPFRPPRAPGAGRPPIYGPGNTAGARLAKRMKSISKVATMLQKKKKQQQLSKPINNPGGLITLSSFSAKNRLTATAYIRKRAGAPNFRISNSPGTFECLSGFQGAGVYSAQNQGRLNEIFNVMPVTQPTGNATRRFLLEHTKLKIVFTNASSASCTLDLYDIGVNADCDITNPLNAWINGVAMSTTTSPNPWQILGAKPWHSTQFKQFFKIMRKRTVNLAAGASHQHSVSLQPNKLINEQRVVENINYKDLSYYTIAVVKGVPVCDNNVTPRLVSSAPIQIDTLVEYSMKYRWITDLDTDLNFTNNMVTLVAPENMNIFQGAPVVVNKAQ